MSQDVDKKCGVTMVHQPHWWGENRYWCNGKPS